MVVPLSEPIYEFVKGQGWVINPGTHVVMFCGTRVRFTVTNEKPADDAICIWDWTMKEHAWKEWLSANKYSQLQASSFWELYDNTPRTWCVVTRV